MRAGGARGGTGRAPFVTAQPREAAPALLVLAQRPLLSSAAEGGGAAPPSPPHLTAVSRARPPLRPGEGGSPPPRQVQGAGGSRPGPGVRGLGGAGGRGATGGGCAADRGGHPEVLLSPSSQGS